MAANVASKLQHVNINLRPVQTLESSEVGGSVRAQGSTRARSGPASLSTQLGTASTNST